MNYDKIMAYPQNLRAFDELRTTHGLSRADMARLLHHRVARASYGFAPYARNGIYRQVYGMAAAWALATKDDPKATFPANREELRMWRLKHGLMIVDLAGWFDISPAMLGFIENGLAQTIWHDYYGMAAAWMELVGELDEEAA